jgi:hypothetical protein
VTQVFTADPTTTRHNGDSGATTVNLSVTPTLADVELVSRLRNLFARARSERQTYVQQWSRNYRVMKNRTWTTGRAPYLPSPEVPECRSTVLTWGAWLTDQRPQFDCMASAAPYSPFANFFEDLAEDMRTALDAVWQGNLYEQRVQHTVLDAAQFSVGIFKTCWNPRLADGLGDVDVRRIDPYTFYPDPVVYEGSPANYYVEASNVSLQELDAQFPGAAERFAVDGYTELIDKRPSLRTGMGQMPRANAGAISPATSATYGLPGQARDRAYRDDTGVTKLEFWLREHTTSTDDNKRTKVFESWRCVVVAGPYILLNKRADELLAFKDHPYSFFRPEDDGEFYPQSMVELLTPMQLSINRALAAIEQNTDLTGNPIMLETAATARTTVVNKPGQRLQVPRGDTNTTRWLDPPNLSEQSWRIIDFNLQRMEHASGLSSISQGVAPGGRIASDVLDSVMESGFVRIRLAQRNLEWCLRDVGNKMAALISEFYTEPRLLSLIGPDGDKTVRTMLGRHFYIKDAEKEPEPLRFQVQVRAGSMLPTSRNARVAEIDTLFAMGGVDRDVLLEAHDIPNRKAIVERIAQGEAKGTFSPPGARQRARR